MSQIVNQITSQSGLSALVGRKCGVTHVYSDAGKRMVTTVVHVDPNCVTALRSLEKNGYKAVQVTTSKISPYKLSKPLAGQYRKIGVEPGVGLWELPFDQSDLSEIAVGTAFGVEVFACDDLVDVISISKGKGFAGTIKRHNFSARMRSNQSVSHRNPGSIGQRQSPGKVFKGKRMAGHMGSRKCTVHSQRLVKIDKERGLLYIKGSVPGSKGVYLIVRKAIKG